MTKHNVTIEVMTFDELSEKAKEKARNWYRDSSYDDATFAWEHIQEDAKAVWLELKSFDTDSASFVRDMKGDFINGAYSCAQLIKAEHGENCDTYKSAALFLLDNEKINQKYPNANNDSCAEFEEEKETIERFLLNNLLKDYSVMLQAELWHMSSDEYIDDTIIANEYTFTEDGKYFAMARQAH